MQLCIIIQSMYNILTQILYMSTFYLHLKVCKDWSDIALTMREEVFAKDDEQLIDIHDIKV